jgi:phosphonate transport system substrate-binding protein
VSTPIIFGLVPSVNPDSAAGALEDLATHLGETISAEVSGRILQNPDQLVAEMERDRVHVAWMSPALLVLAEEHIQLRPIVSTVRGDKTAYRAVMFVHGGTRFQSIEELKGRTAAWVDPSSAAGYLYPRLHLAARGIDPTTFCGNELVLGSHHEVVRAVIEGRAQVGATFAERPPFGAAIRRAGFLEVEGGKGVRVLEWTGLIPNDVVVAHGLMALRQQSAIADALLKLGTTPFGRQLAARVFQADRFMLASRRTLRPLRHLVKVAREQGLLTRL